MSENDKYYLLNDTIVGKKENDQYYLFVEGRWSADTSLVILKHLSDMIRRENPDLRMRSVTVRFWTRLRKFQRMKPKRSPANSFSVF